MKFAILENLDQNPSEPVAEIPTESDPIPSEKPSEPERKISYERILGLINNIGIKLASDLKLSVEEKVEQWIDFLKWVFPHIPEDQQHFKTRVQDMIENPSEWDFMEKPKKTHSQERQSLSL